MLQQGMREQSEARSLKPEPFLNSVDHIPEAPVKGGAFAAVNLYSHFRTDSLFGKSLTRIGDRIEFKDGAQLGIRCGTSGHFFQMAIKLCVRLRGQNKGSRKFRGLIACNGFALSSQDMPHAFFLNEQFHVPVAIVVHDVKQMISLSHRAIFQ